jgi:pimeloyl-ACP methyl ester carboxylesterase
VTGPSALEYLGRRVLTALGFRSETLSTSVGELHLWRVDGTGELPPVLLFHGFGSSAIRWTPLMYDLRPHVRELVALDLPAHGFSQRPDALSQQILRQGMLEALDAVQLPPGLVLGNSLGGAAGLRYALARPERVTGALLFSPAGAPMNEEELEKLRALFCVDAHDEAVALVRALHARDPGLKAHLLAPLVRRPLSDPLLRQWLYEMTSDDFLSAEEIASCTRPVRVIWGKQERILPQRAREFWRAHLPAHSDLVEPDGFGHSPFLDDRGWVVDEILRFSQKLSPSA